MTIHNREVILVQTINKQDFVNAINSMMTIDDYQNDKNKLYKKYQADGFLIEPDNNDVVLRLLKLFLPENADGKVIEDFCLANNYGRGRNNDIVLDKNGNKIQISSPEDLYNYYFEKETVGE